MSDTDFEINGYIVNKSNDAFFKLQRPIPQGGKISFENAFKTLGKKSGLKGVEFLAWLRKNHFPGNEWGFCNPDGSEYTTTSVVSKPKQEVLSSTPTLAPAATPPSPAPAQEVVDLEAPGRGAGKNLRRTSKNQVKKGTEITPSTIIEADYSRAENLINACRDKLVLKKALNLSKHFANKEQHMRHILKRLEQVV